LRSGVVGLEHGELALWAFEKAPIPAIFPDFFLPVFVGFFGELGHQGANGRELGHGSSPAIPE
jgi:hypothetical protein